jgi:hypothetical protein
MRICYNCNRFVNGLFWFLPEPKDGLPDKNKIAAPGGSGAAMSDSEGANASGKAVLSLVI